MFEITKKLNGEIIETNSLPNMSKVWNYAREWRDHLTAEQIGQKAEFIVHDTEAENELMDLRITAKAGKNGKVLMMNSNPASRRPAKPKQESAEVSSNAPAAPAEVPAKRKRKSKKVADAAKDADMSATLDELSESFGCNSDDSNLPEDATEFNPKHFLLNSK